MEDSTVILNEVADIIASRRYRVAEVANLAGVSEVTVRRWIYGDLLPARRLGPRAIRIKGADLRRFLGEY